jgi:hypothetical protein
MNSVLADAVWDKAIGWPLAMIETKGFVGIST